MEAITPLARDWKPAQLAADSLGYGGAIFSAVGLSLAEAVADTKIRATIGTGGEIKADNLTVRALAQLAGTSPTVRGYAEAIGGGALLGANAANSVAKSSLVITASLARTWRLPTISRCWRNQYDKTGGKGHRYCWGPGRGRGQFGNSAGRQHSNCFGRKWCRWNCGRYTGCQCCW